MNGRSEKELEDWKNNPYHKLNDEIEEESDREDEEIGHEGTTDYGSSINYEYSLRNLGNEGDSNLPPFDQEGHFAGIAQGISQLSQKGLKQLRGFLSFLHHYVGIPAEAINNVLKAIFSTAGGYNIPIGILTFLLLWPNHQARAIRPTMASGLGMMFLGLLSGLADLFKSDRATYSRVIWKGVNSGFNAFIFTLSALIGFYVAILKERGYTDDEINDPDSSEYYLIATVIPSAFLGLMHTLIDIRNQILEHRAELEAVNEEDLLIQINPTPEYQRSLRERSKILFQRTGDNLLVEYDKDLPRGKKNLYYLIRALEHLAIILVLASELHATSVHLELITTGKVNEDADLTLTRYGVPLGVATILSGINIPFYNRMNKPLSDATHYLEGLNITTLLILIWLGKNDTIELDSPDDKILPSFGGFTLSLPLLLAMVYLGVQLLRLAFLPKPTSVALPDTSDRQLENPNPDYRPPGYLARPVNSVNAEADGEFTQDGVFLLESGEGEKEKESDDLAPYDNKASEADYHSEEEGEEETEKNTSVSSSSSSAHLSLNHFARSRSTTPPPAQPSTPERDVDNNPAKPRSL